MPLRRDFKNEIWALSKTPFLAWIRLFEVFWFDLIWFHLIWFDFISFELNWIEVNCFAYFNYSVFVIEHDMICHVMSLRITIAYYQLSCCHHITFEMSYSPSNNRHVQHYYNIWFRNLYWKAFLILTWNIRKERHIIMG